MNGALSIADAVEQLGADKAAEAARRAMWRIGDLSYHCSAVQMEARALVYEHRSRRVVWETSRRFGKTRTCVVIADEQALAYPGIRIPYGAPTADQVRAFVHPHMLELANHAPDELAPDLVHGDQVFPPLQWYDQAGNPVDTKAHGGVELARFRGTKVEEQLRMSRVVCAGCDTQRNANRLRGTGTVFAVIDEARDIPILLYVLRSIIGPMLWEARSRWHESVDPVMLVPSTPPDDADHPFASVADAAEAKGARFTANVYDCDHLSERDIAEAIDEAGGEDTVAWQVEGLAKRVRDPERVVFPEWNESLHVGEVERPDYFLPCVVGDAGFTDWDVLGFGYYHFELDLIVIEAEVAMRRARSDTLDAAAREMEAELWPGMRVHRRSIDAAPKVRADMSDPDLQWDDPEEAARLAQREGRRFWHGVSRDGGVSKGRMRSLTNKVRVTLKRRGILVHPRCKTIIAHANAARWAKNRNEFERVKDEKSEPLHHFDGAACLAYFVRDVDTSTNPYPKIPPGVTEHTHHIPATLREEPRKRRLARALGGRRR